MDIQPDGDAEKTEFRIQIDRAEYEVKKREMTGAEIRDLPKPAIGPDLELWEVVPSGDRKIENEEKVEIRDGLRFYTVPAHINPGTVL